MPMPSASEACQSGNPGHPHPPKNNARVPAHHFLHFLHFLMAPARRKMARCLIFRAIREVGPVGKMVKNGAKMEGKWFLLRFHERRFPSPGGDDDLPCHTRS